MQLLNLIENVRDFNTKSHKNVHVNFNFNYGNLNMTILGENRGTLGMNYFTEKLVREKIKTIQNATLKWRSLKFEQLFGAASNVTNHSSRQTKWILRVSNYPKKFDHPTTNPPSSIRWPPCEQSSIGSHGGGTNDWRSHIGSHLMFQLLAAMWTIVRLGYMTALKLTGNHTMVLDQCARTLPGEQSVDWVTLRAFLGQLFGAFPCVVASLSQTTIWILWVSNYPDNIDHSITNPSTLPPPREQPLVGSRGGGIHHRRLHIGLNLMLSLLAAMWTIARLGHTTVLKLIGNHKTATHQQMVLLDALFRAHKNTTGDPPWCDSMTGPRCVAQTMQLNRPPAIMDKSTSDYLVVIARQPLLSAKEIQFILDLHRRHPESKKLAELAARAETERQEITRLTDYANDNWVHQALLSATVSTETCLRALNELEEDLLGADDLITRRFHSRTKEWFAGGRQLIGPPSGAQKSNLSAKRKKGESGDSAEEEEVEEMAQAEPTDEEALASFLDTLKEDERDFRFLMRDTVMSEANCRAVRVLTQLFPCPHRCNAISVAGIHYNVPREEILALAELMSFARNLPIDLETLSANLASGSARTYMIGNLCTYEFPLLDARIFEHGASPFGLNDIHPQVSIVTERDRAKVKGEGGRALVYFSQATNIVGDERRLQIGIGRGIRMDEGLYEHTTGLLISETRDRFAAVREQFDFTVHELITMAYRWKNLGPAKGRTAGRGGSGNQSSSNQTQKDKLVGVMEVYLRIEVSYDGFNVNESQLMTQLRQAIGVVPGGASCLAERGGSQFTYCLSETDGFNDNFHPSHLAPAKNVTSVMLGLEEGRSLSQIIPILQSTCYGLHDMESLYIGRGFAHDNLGVLRKGKLALDKLFIVWKGDNYMGSLGAATMDALLSTLTQPHERSHMRVDRDLGREWLKELNDLMILLATGADGKVGKLKFPVPPPAPPPVRAPTSFGVRRNPGEHDFVRTPAPVPAQAAILNTRESYREQDVFFSAMGGGGRPSPTTPISPPFGPASVLDLGSGERFEYGSPSPWRGHASPSGGQNESALLDPQAINRLISARVQMELAPLKQQNAQLQKKVENLESGIVGIGSDLAVVKEIITEPWKQPQYAGFFKDLIKEATDAGRVAERSASNTGHHLPAHEPHSGGSHISR